MLSPITEENLIQLNLPLQCGQLKECRKRETEGLKRRQLRWERSKEGQDAEEEDWGEDTSCKVGGGEQGEEVGGGGAPRWARRIERYPHFKCTNLVLLILLILLILLVLLIMLLLLILLLLILTWKQEMLAHLKIWAFKPPQPHLLKHCFW